MYITLGLLYLCISVAILSDRPVVVLMRRELSAFFFSPLIYLVLLAMAVIAWFFYRGFLGLLVQVPWPEPIIARYFLDWGPIFIVTFVVPVLTMKLLSEEKRTGSLEVLLTAPVNETSVVVGKFLAALLLFIIMWTPWLFFLVALRIGGGIPFDYRPLFSFFIVLALTGAGFISMGLFFSSLTKNQVASAVLTFAGMILYFGIFLVQQNMQREGAGSGWLKVVEHINYVGLWFRSIDGILVPKFLLFHASMTVFWLFLTVKVLEARRWA
jgi:ABC-type transport system involved in multi-copper enzyme maturation permease subunit